MDSLIVYIVRALVDKADAVEVKTTSVDGGMLYELKVAPEDVGKVIGRDGRTVNALRTVVAAAALKKGEKARVEILDDRRNGSTAVPPPAPGPVEPPLP